MNEFPEYFAGIAGRIMRAAVEVSMGGRFRTTVQFRSAGRVIELIASRLNNGAVDTSIPRTHLCVQLNGTFAEHQLEQMINTLEAMR